MLDDPDDLADALHRVDGLDVPALLAALDSPEVEGAYQADRAEARTAEGSPTEAQGKAAQTDGPVRYTAPSLVFARDERRLEAGGFQPVEAYDVLLANLDPTLGAHAAARGSARRAAAVLVRADHLRDRGDHDARTTARPTRRRDRGAR